MSAGLILSGATGLVGGILSRHFAALDQPVARLVRPSRRHRPETGDIPWNPAAGAIDTDRLEGAETVVHLAGAGIAQRRWTVAWREEILRSRVDGTRLLAESLARLDHPPKLMISASAVGFYGPHPPGRPVDETCPAGEGFLAAVCRQWEAATEAAAAAGIRVVHLRLGLVLHPAGGVLARLWPLFRLGLGARLGDGRQAVSWVAGDDLPGIVRHLMAHPELSGAVNAVSPQPATNASFTRAMRRATRRPAPWVVPAFILRAALGDMAQALLLSGATVTPRRLLESGFHFAHTDLPTWLTATVDSRRSLHFRPPSL